MVLLSESPWFRVAEANACKSAGSAAAKIVSVTSISTSVKPSFSFDVECFINSFISLTQREFNNMVDLTINITLLNCRRELRFPTIGVLGRDSEIAPTEEMSIYF